jgi:hypothetical protein
MDQTGGFSWTGPSKLTPEELMTDRPIAAGLPRRKLVAEWLRQNLLEGKRSQYNIEAAAQRLRLHHHLAPCQVRFGRPQHQRERLRFLVLGITAKRPATKSTGDLNILGGREICKFDHLGKTKDLATATKTETSHFQNV